MLEYLHNNTVNLTEDALKLFELADKYELIGLKVKCEKYLIGKLEVSNVVDIFNVAESCKAERLREIAFRFMSNNIEEIILNDELKKLEKSVIVDLIVEKS